jgi:tight adherence protein B
MQSLTVALIFLIVAAAGFLFLIWLDGRHSQARMLRERIEAIEQAEARQPSEELAVLRDELLSGIPAFNQFLSRSRHLSRLQPWLNRADVKIRAGKFLLICTASSALLGLLALAVFHSPMLIPLFLILGIFVPCMFVSVKRARRFKRFEQLFPEAIDLLGRAVRAGHAFTTALELIGTECAEPVSGEFRKVYEEQKFGLPLRDALLNLSERVPIVDVSFFVTAVMLQRETGGNLADILDKLSYVIRERFKILRQVRTYTAQGRLTMGLLMALPPGCVVMLIFINKDFIMPLFTDPMGHMLLAAGVITQTIGFLIIRKIIAIKV